MMPSCNAAEAGTSFEGSTGRVGAADGVINERCILVASQTQVVIDRYRSGSGCCLSKVGRLTIASTSPVLGLSTTTAACPISGKIGSPVISSGGAFRCQPP